MQHAAALAPVISSLQEEITGLKRELDQQRLQAAVTQQELEGMTSRLGEVGWGRGWRTLRVVGSVSVGSSWFEARCPADTAGAPQALLACQQCCPAQGNSQQSPKC